MSRQVFSSALILLLALEILSPLAFAQSSGAGAPPVIGGAVCELNEFTPQQTRLFWEQSRDFQAQEINSLLLAELLANKPSKGDVSINVNVDRGEHVYPLETIARFINLDEEQTKDAAKFLGKATTDRVTQVEAERLARRYNKDINTLRSFLAGSAPEERPAYEDYKVRLINGAEVPVKALKNPLEFDKACAINNAHIQGRASYAASLGDDLALSFDRAAQKKNTTNRLWSEETNIDLELHGAGTIVVPKQYEELVKRLKFWTMTDVALTAAQVGYFFAGKKFLERRIDEVKEIDDRIAKLGQDTFTTQTLGQNNLKREVFALGSRADMSAHDLGQSLSTMERELIDGFTQGQQFPAGVQTRDQIRDYLLQNSPDFQRRYQVVQNVRSDLQRANIAPDRSALSIFETHQGELSDAAGFLPNEVDEMQKSQIRLRMQRKRTKVLQEIQDQEFETDLRKIKNRLARRTGETWFRILLGMAWLGPGRGVFELTDAINFQQVGGSAFQENYVVVFANQRDLLEDFRKSTNFMMSGTITDALSDLTDEGIPSAAYWIGNLLFINTPVEEVPTATSTTALSSTGGKWHLSSKWSGKSDIYVSEELASESEYARLPLHVKGKSWGVKIKARDEFQAFYQSLHFLIPLLNWRLLGASEYATTGLRLIFYDFYVSEVINPAEFKADEKCDPAKIDGFMDKYAALTIANQAVGWFPVATTYLKTVKVTTQAAKTFMGKVGAFNTLIFGKYISALTQVFDPITLAQAYYADEALEYASHCKDDEYTIIAFQGLRKRVGSTLADRLKSLGSNEILQNLNIGKGTFQLGQQIDTSTLNEYVNLKAEVNNQVSSIKADKLFYLGLKGATIQWISGGEACQRKCLDSDKKGICLDKDGVEVINKETGTATKLANADRAKNHKEVDNFPATIIPNKYITTSLAGCPGPVFQVDGQRSLFLTASATCAGAQCIRSQLQGITGKTTTNDLTPVLGKVLNVYTSQGSADIADGVIRFNAFTTVNDFVELRSPSIESLQNASSVDQLALKQAAALIVNGDGSVLLHGDGPDTSVGQLQTIITERGRINYLPGGQVQVFLHELARVDAGLIKQIATLPVQKDQCTEKVPGIKINRVIGHPGVGDFAEQELNAALEKIQGCNGFQILETADKKFIFTTDENGNPVLRVIDKKTGEATDYKITGPLRQEGNDIIVPTDQGDFRFNIGMGENGQPMLGVKGPNGLDELLPLLAARGFGGVLLFDPRTGQWSAFNGQDLSMDPRFATQGQTYSADSNNNVRGRPGEDLLFPSRRRTTGGNALASLPSWPSELPAIALLVIITLTGVAAIRAKGLKPR